MRTLSLSQNSRQFYPNLPYYFITLKLINFSSSFPGKCSAEYATYGELCQHLDTSHSSNKNFKCHYCNETIQPHDIEMHLKMHQFFTFQCIYCKAFGGNDVQVLRKHLSEKHPSKFSFVASRRQISNTLNVPGIPNVTILYVGDLADRSSYSFFTLPSEIDLCPLDPALNAYKNHQPQLTLPVEKLMHQNPLPKMRFSDISNEFFVDYNIYFAYKCIGENNNGMKCTFHTESEVEIVRHISENHSKREIAYQSRSKEVVKIVRCEFECNLCPKRYKIRKEFDNHFIKSHVKCSLDASIIQNSEVIESSDPNQLVHSQQTIHGRFLYGSLFVCIKDNWCTNTKAKIIAHHRECHSSSEYLEIKLRTTIYARNRSDWNVDELTQENRQFDRLIAYECYHCSNANGSEQSLFPSIAGVEEHHKRIHSHTTLSYIARNLVACAKCKTVSTFDGIRNHHQRQHQTKELPLTCPTSNNHCGICNNYAANYDGITEHFRKIHSATGGNEIFGDRMFKTLRDGNASNYVFMPDCCDRKKFTRISRAADHVIRCPNVNPGNVQDSTIKSISNGKWSPKEFLKLFSNMEILFENGPVFKYQALEYTTFGEELKNKLKKFHEEN